MPMVFISHKLEDEELAAAVFEVLQERHGVACYLDKADDLLRSLRRDPRALTSYLDGRLGQCSTLLAVVSDATKQSWWVPYEIGFLRAHDRPVAVFDRAATERLPEYLYGWPVVYDVGGLAKYARWVKSEVSQKDRLRKGLLTEEEMVKVASKDMSAQELEERLKVVLGQ
jgi:hypothetical protein